MNNNITRQEFLKKTTLASAALMLSSLEGFALTRDDKKIKVAVIGCGSVSTQYLPHLSKAKFVDIVSVCDIIPERAVTRSKEYNVPNNYPHIDKLLAGAPFDLMITLTIKKTNSKI